MTLAMLGGAGMGLVWGWLLVLVGGRTRRQRRLWLNLFVLASCTALVCLLVFVYADWRGLASFLGATAVAVFVSLVWHNSLRLRARPRASAGPGAHF